MKPIPKDKIAKFPGACILIMSIESQKGAITIQRCSIENQKGAFAINFVQW